MKRRLVYTSLLIDDYDVAIDYFTRVLRFTLLEDTPLAPGKRWVVVVPSPGSDGGALLLARAATPQQQALVGGQGGGRVWLFLHTDDIDADVAHLRQHGVQFDGPLRGEPYGRVVVFTDRWGNRWDLIEPAAAP